MGNFNKVFYKNRTYENQGFPILINLVPRHQHRVLDVGCGNGANMDLLSKRGHEVVGITLSGAEAALVRERGDVV